MNSGSYLNYYIKKPRMSIWLYGPMCEFVAIGGMYTRKLHTTSLYFQ